VTLEFAPDGIRRLAEIAFQVNERTENIGARRLHTVMEKLLDMPARSGQRGPSVGAQTRGIVVAVDDARGLRRRDDPARLDVPKLELLLDAPPHGVASHVAAEHGGRRRKRTPVGLRQHVDGFQEHRAGSPRRQPRSGAVEKRPLQPRVADVDGQQAHGKRACAGRAAITSRAGATPPAA
jgi:hypothetical protein